MSRPRSLRLPTALQTLLSDPESIRSVFVAKNDELHAGELPERLAARIRPPDLRLAPTLAHAFVPVAGWGG